MTAQRFESINDSIYRQVGIVLARANGLQPNAFFVRFLVQFQSEVSGLVALQLLVAETPIRVVGVILIAHLYFTAQVHIDFSLEKYRVMQSGNGRTAMLSSHSTSQIHHFRFIVLELPSSSHSTCAK